jgi:hypothetical protein
MMDMINKFALPGIGFLLTLAFGLWLSFSGKPYNGILFNIHKLIALAAVIVTIVQLSQVLKDANSTALIILLLVLAGMCVIALFASGALLSIGNLDYTLVLTIHRIALVGLPIVMAGVVYLVWK